MMPHLQTYWCVRVLASSLLVCLLPACSRTKPARFYVLTPIPVTESVQPISTTSRTINIGVGPIELPDYVDRPQIVTQDGANTFQLAEFDRWAEPLEENFSRILVENLSDLLAPLYSDASGTTTLHARWNIRGNKGVDMLASRQSRSRESASVQDYPATVAAMSQTVAALSQEIATAIQSLPRNKPHIEPKPLGA